MEDWIQVQVGGREEREREDYAEEAGGQRAQRAEGHRMAKWWIGGNNIACTRGDGERDVGRVRKDCWELGAVELDIVTGKKSRLRIVSAFEVGL